MFSSPEGIMGFIAMFISPVITQWLKRIPFLDKYATIVNQVVAVVLMSAAWFFVGKPKGDEYSVWFLLAMAAGGGGTAGYNAIKGK